MLMRMSFTSGSLWYSSPAAMSRFRISVPSPFDDVTPIAQVSAPGQVITSLIVIAWSSASPMSTISPWTAARSSSCTQRNTKFCDAVVRMCPPAYLRAISASECIWSAVTSPIGSSTYTVKYSSSFCRIAFVRRHTSNPARIGFTPPLRDAYDPYAGFSSSSVKSGSR